jgi:cytochrome c oxidase subunit 3
MSSATVSSQTTEVSQPRPSLQKGFGGSPPPSARPTPPISNARLGMLMLISAETMLFVGLVGAYIVFRAGSKVWPSGHLYLPVAVTWLNTIFLLISCYTMHRAIKALRLDQHERVVTWLSLTALLGTIFLAVQGYEWTQLIRDGLTISTGMYGATFYTLIGCHGLHVLAAVVWLLAVLVLATQGRFSASRPIAVEICGMYWYYVGALWAVLFPLVYLN